LVGEIEDERIDIPVPAGDAYFDPYNTGSVVIPMKRSDYDHTTGTSASNPRSFPNAISAFIDASAVYGTEMDRANYLRSFEDGKLRMSFANLLPYNTLSGEYTGDVDPNAIGMAMPFSHVEKYYVAGDVRANENPLLLCMHTLFAREHNRLCDIYKIEYPDWTDDQLYQHCRRLVSGKVQAIVYEEWLPTMGVHLTPYEGYNPNMNPGIMNVFSAAAYRYGHTVINSTIIRMNNDGEVIPQGNMLLRDAFFNPYLIVESGGIDPLLNGMGTQIEQDFDCKMIHDLRNFLFGPPGAGGMDLASININRGRERGLPDYNTVREKFGLPRINSFSEMTANPWLNQIFQEAYGDIDKIDPWVGFLSENHMENTLFGESVMEIMIYQFTALRDGDRFYYENDPALSEDEKTEIKETRLYDIIMNNSDINAMQKNVFISEEHIVTRVDDIANNIDINVYPNPLQERINIELYSNHRKIYDVKVVDVVGRVHLQTQYTALPGGSIIHLESEGKLAPGIYYVIVKSDEAQGQVPVFVENN
jgi:predicted nucleotidyltransferase